MKTTHKITFILLLLPLLSFAGIVKGKYTREKKIEKSFNVNNNAALQVMNKYGTVTITTWDQDKTDIEVNIIVSGNNEETVEKRFNSIDVKINGTSTLVEAYTKFAAFSGRNISMEINYVVKIPKNGTLGLGNMYGDIRLGKINGGINLQIQYGNLYIEEANADVNKLDLQYANGSRIGYIKAADIKMQYSNIEANKIGQAVIKSEYSDLKVTNLNDVKTKMAYSNLTTGVSGKVIVESEYSNVKCDRLTSMLTASLSYGNLKINTITNDVKVIAVKNEYGETRLGFAPNAGFNFDFTTEYGNVSGKNLLNFNESIEKSFSAHYTGTSKSGTTNCKVTAKTSYGDIKISVN